MDDVKMGSGGAGLMRTRRSSKASRLAAFGFTSQNLPT
jgi:hypothetical protein